MLRVRGLAPLESVGQGARRAWPPRTLAYGCVPVAKGKSASRPLQLGVDGSRVGRQPGGSWGDVGAMAAWRARLIKGPPNKAMKLTKRGWRSGDVGANGPRFGLKLLHDPRGARASQLIPGVRRTNGGAGRAPAWLTAESRSGLRS